MQGHRCKVIRDNRPVLGRERKSSVECADRELGRQQRSILAADAEDGQRTGIADDGGFALYPTAVQ
ncbi:MAG TPA: hypothetical protein VGG11_09420 [Xanthobacteraceae bacterium]